MFDIDGDTSNRVCDLVAQGYNGFKWGWARVNFNYFISPEELHFICDAILQIAEHGWKLLPMYQFDLKSSLFVHKVKEVELSRPSLTNFHLVTPQEPKLPKKKKTEPQSFQQVLEDAKNIYETAERFLRLFGEDEASAIIEPLPDDIISEDDIWWVTSKDVMESIRSQHQHDSMSRTSFKAANVQKDAWSIALEA